MSGGRRGLEIGLAPGDLVRLVGAVVAPIARWIGTGAAGPGPGSGPALPALLGVSANTVQARLRTDAPLVRSGLVSVDSDGDLHPLDRLNRLAAAPAGSGTDVHRLLPCDSTGDIPCEGIAGKRRAEGVRA